MRVMEQAVLAVQPAALATMANPQSLSPLLVAQLVVLAKSNIRCE